MPSWPEPLEPKAWRRSIGILLDVGEASGFKKLEVVVGKKMVPGCGVSPMTA
jgi:hypothetical protein